MLILLQAADECFVHLDGLAFAAQWPAFFGEQFAHTFADAMGHKPSGAVRAEAEHAPKLMGAHAFLRGRH